jgi:HEAT repeat protein
MPFAKRGDATPTPVHKDKSDAIASHVAVLANPDPDARWNAARALGGRAEAVSALAAALKAEQVPRVREAIMTALMRVGDSASVTALLPYLRSQDAAARSSAIEALQSLPGQVGAFMDILLRDGDSDVRLLACELARSLPAEQATQILCALITRETHPNVSAAAVDVLAEVGTPAAVPVLEACAKRFAATPFLPFAISIALARIAGSGG